MNDLLAPTPPEHGANGPEPQDGSGSALATARDVTSEILRLLQTTATQATNGWSLATLMRSIVPELEQVFSARETLRRDAEALRVKIAGAAESVREMESQHAARETGWRAERAALEADAAREREHARALAQDLERRRTELDMLEGRTRRLREQMEGIATRAHTDREETLRLAREMVQAAEEARVAVLDEMEGLRSALVAEQTEQARASQGVAEREAELHRVRQLLEQLEASRAGTAAELARVRASLVHAERELLAAQHEYQIAQVQIDRLLGAHDDLVEDRAQLTAKLHDASEREARLRLRITGLEQRIQAVRDGAPTDDIAIEPAPDAPSADPRVAELAEALSGAEGRAGALEHELSVVKAGASAATSRIEGMQDQRRDAERARAAAEQRVASLEATVAELRRARDEVVARPAAEPLVPAPIEPEGGDAPADTAGDDEVAMLVEAAPEIGATALDDLEPEIVPIELTSVEAPPTAPEPEIENDQPPPGGPAWQAIEAPPDVETVVVETLVHDAVPAPTEPGRLRSVAVLDASDRWTDAEDLGAACVPPTADVAERVRTLEPEGLLVNLATPGVLAAVLALRTGGITTPLRACALGEGAGAGIDLGAFDLIARPVDPDRVRVQLEPLVQHGTSVVMVGTESAVLIPLRQGLLQIGASVRTAWTIAQATDLSTAGTPGLVIVDLAADQTGIAEFVVELARRDTPPVLVAVAGAGSTLDAFGKALAAHATSSGRDRADLVRAAATGTRAG